MSQADFFDSSDKSAVRRAVKAAKRDEAQLRLDLRSIMQTEHGRRWIHSLLERSRVFDNPFSTDPGLMAFSCGEKNIGLQLIAELHEVSTDLYLIMMKENSDGNRTSSNDRSGSTDDDASDGGYSHVDGGTGGDGPVH